MLYRKTLEEVSDRHKFVAVAYAVKDIVIDQWIATQKAYEKADAKTVYYLSMEFLMGRALGNMIINLSSRNEIKEAIEELGLDLNVIEDQEPDAALGNGITFGMTPDEVKAVMRRATDSYTSDTSDYMTLTYEENDDAYASSVEFTFQDGVLTKFDMENYN